MSSGLVSCPAFDNLLGSSMLFGNAEFRFPLFGVLHLGTGYYGALPVEMAIFGDAGVAWNGTKQAWFLPGAQGPNCQDADVSPCTRRPVFSAGVAWRLNLLGFAVLEIDAARPFNRPGVNGFVWQFGLTPGF